MLGSTRASGWTQLLTLMQYGEIRGAEGVAFDKAKEEIHITTKEELLVDIQIYLASKAAEIVFLGTETAGMGGDLPGASCRSGPVRPLRHGRPALHDVGRDADAGRAPTGRAGHAAAVPGSRRLVEANQPQVHAIVEALLEKEELLGEEVEEIVARIDREVGRTTGRVVDLPTPQPPGPARARRWRLPRRSATLAPAAPPRNGSRSGPPTTAWRTVRCRRLSRQARGSGG